MGRACTHAGSVDTLWDFLTWYMKSRSGGYFADKTVRVHISGSAAHVVKGGAPLHNALCVPEMLLAGKPLLCSGTGKRGRFCCTARPLRSHCLRQEVGGAPDFLVLDNAHGAPRASEIDHLDGRTPSGISISEIFWRKWNIDRQ